MLLPKPIMKKIKERKLNRMRGFDYSQVGHYFVTICSKNRECYFGDVVNDEMKLNQCGKTADLFWRNIPIHFPNIDLDAFIVMPNHMHGIIIVGNNENPVGNNDRCFLHPISNNRNMELIPKILSQYKSSVSREMRKKYDDFEFKWQKSFYDHIIRDEQSLNNIREYIINNPIKWAMDRKKS